MQNSDSLGVEFMGQVYINNLLERMKDRFVIRKHIMVSLKERLEFIDGDEATFTAYTFALRTVFTEEQIKNKNFPLEILFDAYWASLKVAWPPGTSLVFRIPLTFTADWDAQGENLTVILRSRIGSFIAPKGAVALKQEGKPYANV